MSCKASRNFTLKSFRFMGAKTYNELPAKIRKTGSLNAYEQHLKQYSTQSS